MDISKAEEAFRAAALAIGNAAFLAFLSALPESTPVCPECGRPMTSHSRRDKNITGMLGDGKLSRTYYGCDKCHTHAIPKDEMLGISGTSFTPGVKRAAARLAASEPFESCSQLLWELCGINICSKDTERISESVGEVIRNESSAQIETVFADPEGDFCVSEDSVPVLYIEYDGTGVPVTKAETEGRAGRKEDGTAKTREMKVGCVFTQHGTDGDGHPVRDKGSTSYFAAIEKSEEFGRRVYAEALRRGCGKAERVIVLGDGAKWIWAIADLHFPGAAQIVDLFHAKEHLSDLLKIMDLDKEESAVMKNRMYELLEAGDISALTSLMSVLPADSETAMDAVSREIGYFLNNAHRMNYAEFRKQGLFVGSGVIEAGCKNVIGKRLKQSGMHWSVRGANSIAALRCKLKSGEFDDRCLSAA